MQAFHYIKNKLHHSKIDNVTCLNLGVLPEQHFHAENTAAAFDKLKRTVFVN